MIANLRILAVDAVLREKLRRRLVLVTKKFRTRAQAEAFIEDWKETYADVWREMIKEVLDQGFRPRDIEALRTGGMKSIIEQFMYKPGKSTEMGELTAKAKQLSLQHPKQKN
jgi:hypothetical protein